MQIGELCTESKIYVSPVKYIDIPIAAAPELCTCNQCAPVRRVAGWVLASVRAVHSALAGALPDHRVTLHGDYAV